MYYLEFDFKLINFLFATFNFRLFAPVTELCLLAMSVC